ncbi:MAG: DUF378 domain-containing protein [bacterium]|nr:DUF378 domain-containing protein [bacterium]
MKGLHIISFIILVVGGLNWGLIGIGGWDIVAYLGEMPARVVYILVGVAALVEVFTHKATCRACKSNSDAPAMGGQTM